MQDTTASEIIPEDTTANGQGEVAKAAKCDKAPWEHELIRAQLALCDTRAIAEVCGTIYVTFEFAGEVVDDLVEEFEQTGKDYNLENERLKKRKMDGQTVDFETRAPHHVQVFRSFLQWCNQQEYMSTKTAMKDFWANVILQLEPNRNVELGQAFTRTVVDLKGVRKVDASLRSPLERDAYRLLHALSRSA